jgi:hypothetical protein
MTGLVPAIPAVQLPRQTRFPTIPQLRSIKLR